MKIITQIRGRQNYPNRSHSNTVFAYEDTVSDRLFVMLGILEEHDENKVKFIAQMDVEETQPCIMVSKEPVYNHNECAYFLLICKSKREKLVRLCYLLAETVYISGNSVETDHFLRSMKGVEPYWKHRNAVVLVISVKKDGIMRQQEFGGSTSDTRDLHQQRNSSKPSPGKTTNHTLNLNKANSRSNFTNNSVEDRTAVILNKNGCFREYFKVVRFADSSVLGSQENIVQHFKGFGFDESYFLIPKYITHIVQVVNYSQNCLRVQPLVTGNVAQAIQQILCQSLRTYSEMLKMQFKQCQTFSLQSTRETLRNLADSTIDSFNTEAYAFLQEPSYVTAYQRLQSMIKEEESKVVQLIGRCNSQHSMRRLREYQDQEFIQFDTLIGLDSLLLGSLFTDFQSYSEVLIGKTEAIFQEFLNRADNKIKKKKKQGNSVVSNRDRLENLEERIGIYKEKKQALENQVRLGEREDEKLMELVRGL